jgi:hypothetical protein
MSCTGGCGGSSKWALLTAAVDKLVVGIGSVNWGLMFFGTDDACGTNLSPAVATVPSGASSMAIVGALRVATPGGDAPTTAALSAAVQYLGSLSDESPKYVLLVTDGKPGCSSDPGTANFSFPTFVLAAVAPSDTTAIAALTQMAVNGGQPQEGGANAFYTTTDDLSAQLDPTRVTLATSDWHDAGDHRPAEGRLQRRHIDPARLDQRLGVRRPELCQHRLERDELRKLEGRKL